MAGFDSDYLRIPIESGKSVVRLQKMNESDVDCLRISIRRNQVAALFRIYIEMIFDFLLQEWDRTLCGLRMYPSMGSQVGRSSVTTKPNYTVNKTWLFLIVFCIFCCFVAFS